MGLISIILGVLLVCTFYGANLMAHYRKEGSGIALAFVSLLTIVFGSAFMYGVFYMVSILVGSALMVIGSVSV